MDPRRYLSKLETRHETTPPLTICRAIEPGMALMCSPGQVATQRAIRAVDAEKKPHSHQSGRLQCQTVATKTAEQTKTGSVSYMALGKKKT